jgi:hypothetical protein
LTEIWTEKYLNFDHNSSFFFAICEQKRNFSLDFKVSERPMFTGQDGNHPGSFLNRGGQLLIIPLRCSFLNDQEISNLSLDFWIALWPEGRCLPA